MIENYFHIIKGLVALPLALVIALIMIVVFIALLRNPVGRFLLSLGASVGVVYVAHHFDYLADPRNAYILGGLLALYILVSLASSILQAQRPRPV